MSKEEIKTRDHLRWQGTYKGIDFQFCKWKPDYYKTKLEYDTGYKWNYYIFVKPRRLKTTKYKDYPKRVDYYKMYPDVEMHGGITYWSRSKTSSLREVDEIGCDYSHSWDDGCAYDEKDMLMDIKKTIDTLPADLFFN